jgi:Uma2 family endonuclease
MLSVLREHVIAWTSSHAHGVPRAWHPRARSFCLHCLDIVYSAWHGVVCNLISRRPGNWVEDRNLGRTVSNDSGIVTRRGPDTLRGADLAYYGFARISKGSHPERYPDVPPEIVIEVRSPSDRWKDIHEKVAEYLGIGVSIVCVIDPELRTAWLYFPDQPDRIVGPEGELTFPESLADFSVPMKSLFE